MSQSFQSEITANQITDNADAFYEASDTEKINAYFAKIHDASFPMPVLAGDEATTFLTLFFNDLGELVNGYGKKLPKQ